MTHVGSRAPHFAVMHNMPSVDDVVGCDIDLRKRPMRRRNFITLVGSVAAGWPLAAHAQQAGRIWRIGLLMLVAEVDPQAQAERAAFAIELRHLGWTEGQNIQVDERWANGDVSRLQALAAELVDLKPDLLVAQGSAALAALQHATRTLPIVFADVTDPVGQGLVESLTRPGGNTTGFAMFEVSMGGKWLDLLKKLTPSTERVAILSNPVTSTAPFGKLYFQSINAAAPRFGIKPFSLEVDNKADLEQRLSELAREPNSGLIVLLDAFTYVHRDIIIDQAARHRIPAIYTVSFFAEAGGLASYGVDLAAQFGQAATYVDRIFKGTKPADLPVQQPTKFKLVINLKAAKGLGITIPQSLLVTADEVME
jgi:putative tryptophan/tyrosine transport system substrate-binding protein